MRVRGRRPGLERAAVSLGRQELDDALALLRVAGELAGRAPAVEEVLRAGDGGSYRWASMAQSLRYLLYGGDAGGALERPAADSLLGQMTEMTAWSTEHWERLYQTELGAFEEERGEISGQRAIEAAAHRANGQANGSLQDRRPNPAFRESFLAFYFDPSAAGTLRAFGELLHEVAVEGGSGHSQDGRSFLAREMDAAALDIEHVVQELGEAAGDPEPGLENTDLAGRAGRVATRLHALARELSTPPNGSESPADANGPRLGPGANGGERP